MATMPVAEGGGQKSGPNWLLIGGAGASVVALILIMSKSSQGSGGGTTAAGVSINAALGSIQEQIMNVLGQQGQDTATITTQMGAGFTDLGNQMGSGFDSLSNQLTTVYTGLGQQIGALSAAQQHMLDAEAGLSTQLSAVNSGVIANGQAITGLNSSLKTYFDALGNQMTAGQQQENQYYQQLQGSIGNVANMTASNQAALLAELGQLAGDVQKISVPQQFQGIDISKYNYIWYQPIGANQYQAAMWKVTNGQAQGISWQQYMQETGRTSFDFANPANLTIRSGYATGY